MKNQCYTTILPADYSDPDVIRVGKDYYMVASSFMDAPGVPVMHSRDLLHWETISYAVPNTRVLGEIFSWKNMGGYSRYYGHGIYACSIRYHEDSQGTGTWYVYIPVYPSGGIFVSKAKDPRGPWTVEKIVDKHNKHIQYNSCQITDICPFWDEDGTPYLIISHLGGSSDYDMDGVGAENTGHPAYVYQMNEKGNKLIDCDGTNKDTLRKTGVLVRNIKNTEGNKIYKIGNYYYFLNVDFLGRSPRGKGAYIRRSRFLFGALDKEHPDIPYTDYARSHHGGYYETRYLGEDSCIPTQGGLVDTPDGKWFFVGQADRSNAAGRQPCMAPFVWKKGWPVFGIDRNGDGEKPIREEYVPEFVGSDDFDSDRLSLLWQWNHQPREGYWSLTERPGYLRLKAFHTINFKNDFWKAGNTIFQRYIDKKRVEVTVKMDISHMTSGQEAGLCLFNGGTSYTSLGVVQNGPVRQWIYTWNGTVQCGETLDENSWDIWIRADIDEGYYAFFSYSLDGRRYQGLPVSNEIQWGSYRGIRIGIYTFNNVTDHGYIDVDYYQYQHHGNRR